MLWIVWKLLELMTTKTDNVRTPTTLYAILQSIVNFDFRIRVHPQECSAGRVIVNSRIFRSNANSAPRKCHIGMSHDRP